MTVRFMASLTVILVLLAETVGPSTSGKKLKLIAVMLWKEARTFACGLLYLGYPKLMLFD